ncbi:hypothetical protein COOONC_25858 [Cooperia oncophora]
MAVSFRQEKPFTQRASIQCTSATRTKTLIVRWRLMGFCYTTQCADDSRSGRDLSLLLKEWRTMTKPEEADMPMDFTSCTRSRHEKQW